MVKTSYYNHTHHHKQLQECTHALPESSGYPPCTHAPAKTCMYVFISIWTRLHTCWYDFCMTLYCMQLYGPDVKQPSSKKPQNLIKVLMVFLQSSVPEDCNLQCNALYLLFTSLSTSVDIKDMQEIFLIYHYKWLSAVEHILNAISTQVLSELSSLTHSA